MSDRMKLEQFETQLQAYEPIIAELKNKQINQAVSDYSAAVAEYRRQIEALEAAEIQISDLPNQALQLGGDPGKMAAFGARVRDLRDSRDIAEMVLPAAGMKSAELWKPIPDLVRAEVEGILARIGGDAGEKVRRALPVLNKKIADVNQIALEAEVSAAHVLQAYAKTGAPAVETMTGARSTLDETQKLVADLIHDSVKSWGKAFDLRSLNKQELRIFQAMSRGLATGARTPEEQVFLSGIARLWIKLFYGENGN